MIERQMPIQGVAIIYARKVEEVDVRIITDHDPSLQEINSLMVEGSMQLMKNLVKDHLHGADEHDKHFEDIALRVLAYHKKLTDEHYGGENKKQIPDDGVSEVRPPVSTTL